MDDPRRFSAAPVNFDRFVSLNRSHSRSLSPDNELHQMLRPYQSRLPPTANTATAGTLVHRKAATSSSLPSSKVVSGKAERRSTDMLAATSSNTVTVDASLTQAATPPSRSVSGGAATTSTIATTASADLTNPAESRPEPQYYNVEEETAELERSQFFVPEEVDVLLSAVQLLGSPLYNPVSREFVCWKLHPLTKRSRASYGDIEGVSCDFCGHTDWLDSLVQAEPESRGGRGALADIKKEPESKDGHHAASQAHSRYFYHCSACKVDICGACLAEVQADERFHVPCLQCQRCGAYETRRNAPLHQCCDAAAVKAETAAEGTKATSSQAVLPPRPSMREPLSAEQTAMSPQPSLLAHAATTSAPKKVAGVTTVRGHVRLGLSRRLGGAAVSATAAASTGPAHAKVTAVGLLDEEPTSAPVSSVHPAAPPPPRASAASNAYSTSSAIPRKRAAHASRSTTANTKPRAKLETSMDDSDGDDSVVEVMSPALRQKPQGALPPRNVRARTPESYSSSPDTQQALLLQSSILSTARYEVHLTPQSNEEVEAVRRMSREQHLLLLPAPSPRRTSVAFFPTRLAAESCVERATAGSVEAILKRHINKM